VNSADDISPDAMANSRCWIAKDANMAGDWYVVRRIGENKLSALLAKQGLVGCGDRRVSANQAMAADLPDVARASNGRVADGSPRGLQPQKTGGNQDAKRAARGTCYALDAYLCAPKSLILQI
jgi:hypothetical protein